MSELIKTSLKELSQDLNTIQTKKKDIAKRFDLDSKLKLVNEINLIKDKVKKIVDKIDREYEIISDKLRSEYIGAIRSNKTEFDKMVKEIDKIHNQLKKEKLIDKTLEPDHDSEGDKYNYLNTKMNKQNDKLTKAQHMGQEITTSQDKTFEELVRQKNKLIEANTKVHEVEQTLSIHDQIVAVMSNRELFNKLKLVCIVVLLVIADLIVLYVKLH